MKDNLVLVNDLKNGLHHRHVNDGTNVAEPKQRKVSKAVAMHVLCAAVAAALEDRATQQRCSQTLVFFVHEKNETDFWSLL